MNTIYRDLFPIEAYFGQFTKFNQAQMSVRFVSKAGVNNCRANVCS